MSFADIHVGRDGWIFLVGGSNQVLRLYTDDKEVPPEAIQRWAEVIRRRIALATEVGARYVHLVAPEKIAVYRENSGLDLPPTLVGPAARVGARLREMALDRHFVDLTGLLRRTATDTAVYLRTDTHWTYDGMRVIYAEACARLGLSPAQPLPDREVISFEGVFDLGGKAEPSIPERSLHLPFLPGIERVEANAIATMWDENARLRRPILIHNSLHVVYRNTRPDAQDERVVLFGDSFLDFRPTTLSSFFVEQFRETHIIWSTSLDEAYVRRVGPTILVTENAERFMRIVPDDSYRLERDAARRVMALRERRGWPSPKVASKASTSSTQAFYADWLKSKHATTPSVPNRSVPAPGLRHRLRLRLGLGERERRRH